VLNNLTADSFPGSRVLLFFVFAWPARAKPFKTGGIMTISRRPENCPEQGYREDFWRDAEHDTGIVA
jgi:hypothetical protein